MTNDRIRTRTRVGYMKLSRREREKAIKILVEADVENCLATVGTGKDDLLRDILLTGHKGYLNMTDEVLLKHLGEEDE